MIEFISSFVFCRLIYCIILFKKYCWGARKIKIIENLKAYLFIYYINKGSSINQSINKSYLYFNAESPYQHRAIGILWSSMSVHVSVLNSLWAFTYVYNACTALIKESIIKFPHFKESLIYVEQQILSYESQQIRWLNT